MHTYTHTNTHAHAQAQETPRHVESTPVESVVLKTVRRQRDLDSPLGTPRLPLNEVITPQVPRVKLRN